MQLELIYKIKNIQQRGCLKQSSNIIYMKLNICLKKNWFQEYIDKDDFMSTSTLVFCKLIIRACALTYVCKE